jgi:murein peptide amidase A
MAAEAVIQPTFSISTFTNSILPVTGLARSKRLPPIPLFALAACACMIASLALALALVEPASAGERAVIGHSVRGRPITAALKGDPSAPERVLVIGCVHGNEPAGLRVARKLIAGAPARDAAIWVVPSLNPDGVAAHTRGNARGVDLNRNFRFDWQPLGGLEYSGTHAFSEPESRAARRLILRVQPDITIWFHQPFDLVDRSGGDPTVERRFSRLLGLPLVRLRRYPGSATSWQNHTLPRSTAFVVELPLAVSGALVGRATKAVRTLASEYGSPRVGGATAATSAAGA